ncbi:hypothetical protein Tco_1490477 [Tanacetum coccineum]
MQAAYDRQKSYANLKRKPMEFQVGDRVMLKVSPWKGVVRFGKLGKLNPRYVGPFKVLEKVGFIAYKLELPQELSRVHNTFHLSNLKKCYSDEPLAIPLEGLHVDDKIHIVEEPVEIMDREVKWLKQIHIPIVKVNEARGAKDTLRILFWGIWDNEDVHDLGSVETEFPTIFFNDTLTSEATLSCEPTVSSLNNDEIDFRISFDEPDDEDCMVMFDKNSFSYKISSVNDLKTDLENNNDKANMSLLPSPEPMVICLNDLDFFKDFENEFSAIVYNDALTSKSDFLTEPALSPQNIDEFNLKDETSLSEYDEEEQNVICFNDLFSFNVIYHDDSKSDKDNNDDKIDIKQPSGGPREGKSTNIGGEFANLEILKYWSLETSRRLFNTRSCS